MKFHLFSIKFQKFDKFIETSNGNALKTTKASLL
nr:MAG TPA: hypothetical protein [Bacteriophage sp.]